MRIERNERCVVVAWSVVFAVVVLVKVRSGLELEGVKNCEVGDEIGSDTEIGVRVAAENDNEGGVTEDEGNN